MNTYENVTNNSRMERLNGEKQFEFVIESVNDQNDVTLDISDQNGILESDNQTNSKNTQIPNMTWIADNNYNVFENINDKWVENLDGIPTFEFHEVSKNEENSVLLFDPKRQVFVQLNEHDSNYGLNQDELRPLYNGRWRIVNDSFLNHKESEPQVNNQGKI